MPAPKTGGLHKVNRRQQDQFSRGLFNPCFPGRRGRVDSKTESRLDH
jgi:hypothetical protein